MFCIFSNLQPFGVSGVKGDLVVQLVPEPLPELSTGSQDQELDVTLDEDTPPVSENTQPEEGSVRTEEELSTQGERPLMPMLSGRTRTDLTISHESLLIDCDYLTVL